MSGGLDSAIVASIARPTEAFTSIVRLGQDYDEEIYAENLAKKIGVNLHKIVPTIDDFIENIADVVWYLDQPTTTLAVLPQFLIAKKVQQAGFKVILNGLGADELFGGYIRYLIVYAWRDFLNIPQFQSYFPLLSAIWDTSNISSVEHIYTKLISRSSASADIFAFLKEIFSEKISLLNKMGLFDIKITLPPLLTTEDRAAAHVGLESRSPFLDYRLAKFAFSLPEHLKIHKFNQEYTTKYLLRMAFADILPTEIVHRIDTQN